MNYLSAENIGVAYGDKLLFENLNFGLAQGQKVALVGINGCGKSTLLKVLGGVQIPDEGNVSVRKGVKVRFLAQEPILDPNMKAADVLFYSDHPAMEAIRNYESLMEKSQEGEDVQKALQVAMERIDTLDAWDIEVKIQQILTQLEVNFLDKSISQLSGGQKKRVAMARVLIEEPELIILDEPTNHLDLQSIEWLEKFLATSKQTLLMVTHDRYFLDNITTEIVELEGGKLHQYKGNYAFFLEKKAEREALHDRSVDKAQSLLVGELDWLRRSPKARTTKSQSRIDSVHALQDKATNFRDTTEIKLRMEPRRLGGKILEIEKISKSYGELTLLKDFSYIFKNKDRVGIVGKNGVGKSTFLNMITGSLAPDSGKIETGETVAFGYYEQAGMNFKPGHRIIDVVKEAAEIVHLGKGKPISAESFLEYFMFPRKTHYTRVESLSGGEKRRLHLLRVLMTQPNFLILDEPTNDLDLITLRKLEEFLMDFPACLMIVSHDRYFMDRLVDHIFVFEGEGQIKDYPGSYSQYQKWKAEEKAKQTKAIEKEKTSTNEQRNNNRKQKLSFKEKREFEGLEAEIEALENEKTNLTEFLNSGESDYVKLQEASEKLKRVEASLEEKEFRWLELSEIEG